MECGLSVRKHVVQLLVSIALMLPMAASMAEDTVVLVTHSDSSVEDISSLDIRKAYLGILVTVDGSTIRPIRRQEDERLNMIFLQSVVAMSQKSYERRLISMMLKFGTPRPIEVDSGEELLEQLVRNPGAIAYMWKSDADAEPRVSTIRVLWQER